MKGIFTWYGQSLLFNSLFVLVNFIGVVFITMGFHPNFEEYKGLFIAIGLFTLIISIVGIIILKGKLFMSFVSRILVGSLFIVSGLIKANDPLGFSYKLEEYFEDGALAFRIKEWFSAPSFSLEFLVDYALFFSVLICIVEIVLGVLVIIGGKIRFTSWMLLLTMIFFTFLTWHTANCDPNKKFIDRDTYAQNDPVGLEKLQEAKTNKEIKIVSKINGEIIVNEMKQPQCVSDCGCFGDAMKGSVGRSLTPSESLWKDYILMYFVFWIFIAQRTILANTTKQNVYIIPISLAVVFFFSFVFGWYFPILFAFVSILSALWINRAGGKYLSNYWASAGIVVVICLLFTSYVLNYDAVKDYRPFAEGSDLKAKMNDGIEGKYLNLLVYKNLKTGEIKEYEGSSNEYIKSKIWEKTNLWKYDTMVTKEIIPTRLPSITTDFNPIVNINELGNNELNFPYIKKQLANKMIDGVVVYDIENQSELAISNKEYEETYSDTSFYEFKRRTMVENSELQDISIRDFIIQSPTIFVLSSNNLSEANLDEKQKVIHIARMLKARKIPFVLICNADRQTMNAWRRKNGLKIPAFSLDEKVAKAIARSNPSLMIIQNGIVKGKYPNKSIPSFEWIEKHVLTK
jgi:uncharacterized membrane protein YphA (DoxX/SURF4 family)